MIDIDEWLNEPLENGQPRHERICYLITANGGNIVRQWGFLSWRNGHQVGLEQNEAIELIQYDAFIRGLSWADVPIVERIAQHMDAYKAKLTS